MKFFKIEYNFLQSKTHTFSEAGNYQQTSRCVGGLFLGNVCMLNT